MKNRRIVLVAFLLCACMIVGVGYAAVVTTLNIDGRASFNPSESHEFNEEIHFTGVTSVVNSKHVVVENQTAIIAAAQEGDQRAVLSASFASDNIEGFKDSTSNNYVAGVMFEVAVVCPADATEMTVTFVAPEVSGAVGQEGVATNADFIVGSHLKLKDDDTGADVTSVTVKAGETVYLELHVRLEMKGTQVVAIPDTDFDVILPVTSVVKTTANS